MEGTGYTENGSREERGLCGLQCAKGYAVLVVYFFFKTKLATRQDIILLSNIDVPGTDLSTLQDRVVVEDFNYSDNSWSLILP